jgi:dihydropyrimidinase
MLDVARLTSYAPARIFNLFPRKGTLMVGSDADLAVIDPNLHLEVNPAMLKSAADFTPFDGSTLTGWPTLTMVRGVVMMRDRVVVGAPGHGQYLKRSPIDGWRA